MFIQPVGQYTVLVDYWISIMPQKYKHKRLGRIAEFDERKERFVVDTRDSQFQFLVLPETMLKNSNDRDVYKDMIDEAYDYFTKLGRWKENFRRTVEKFFFEEKESIPKLIEEANEKLQNEWGCTLQEAMEILWTDKRYNVDIPLSKWRLKRLSKKWESLVLDKQSVIDYKESKGRRIKRKCGQWFTNKYPAIVRWPKIERIEDWVVKEISVQGPGIKNFEMKRFETKNNPAKIMGEDVDDDY